MKTKESKTTIYKQLCVWYGCSVKENSDDTKSITDFEDFMLKEFNARIKYHTEVKTRPDYDSTGSPIPETGGRNDLFFYVHSDDISNFAIPRLKAGIRWWEDVVGYNDNSHLYEKEFINAHPLTW